MFVVTVCVVRVCVCVYHSCLTSTGEGCTWLTAMCDTAGPGRTSGLMMRGPAITEGPHSGAPMGTGPAITAGPSRLGDGPGAGAGAGAAAAKARRATKTHWSKQEKEQTLVAAPLLPY